MADELDIIVVSWDGHNINDGNTYTCGPRTHDEWGLPDVKPDLVERDGNWPVLGGLSRSGKDIQLAIQIEEGADLRTSRDQLLAWFDPEDETAKKLIIKDQDGTNSRYVYAICKSLKPSKQGVRTFVIQLVIDGDVRWRANTETSDTWNITASGQTHTVTNGGTDYSYPTFEITPTSSKTGGFAYKQFIPIKWRTNYQGQKYPVRLGPLDTSTLVGAGKMQADGDDLRVYANGTEIDRWLVDMNTASTYIWIWLDFVQQATDTLLTTIAATGSIASIEIGEGIYDMPESGIVAIDSEVFTYSARDLFEEKLTGVTRAAKGSSMGLHSAGVSVYWLQNDVIIAYGNATLTAPTVDDDYEPMFSMAAADSSNTQWHYTAFGDAGGKRTGRWTTYGNITLAGNGGAYTATQRTLASGDYSVAGAWLSVMHGNAFGWKLYNPCGIVNAAWADGYMRAVVKENWTVHLMYWPRDDSWWIWQATLADPALDNTWEAWSESAAGSPWDEANTLAIVNYFQPSDVEVGTVTVTLSSTETPSVDMAACAEQGNYSLDCIIENETTGESISVAFDMELNETLVVNTDDETVIYEADDTSQFQAVEWSSVRRDWLKLSPGDNTIKFTDASTAAVTVVTKFNARSY